MQSRLKVHSHMRVCTQLLPRQTVDHNVETLSRGALACIVMHAVTLYLDIFWIIALQSSHEVHSHAGSQVWVLPIGLAASTPSWVSEDVYVWAKAVKSTAIRSTAWRWQRAPRIVLGPCQAWIVNIMALLNLSWSHSALHYSYHVAT